LYPILVFCDRIATKRRNKSRIFSSRAKLLATNSSLLLIFQLFTKQYLAKLLHCMAWNYQAAKQKTFGSTGDCGQWNFLKAE